MARRPRDARIETREARRKLPARKEPYWRQIHKGLAVGYYRGVKSGSWHVRRTVDGRKVYQRIGKADDYADADGTVILSYDQAVQAAMTSDQARPATPEGKYTVKEAIADYLEDLKARSPRGHRDAEQRFDFHVIPKLGSRPVASLTREQVRRWHQGLATVEGGDADDFDAIRKRRNTANRNLSALKAALNFAYHEGRVSHRSAWDAVRPFKQVDEPRQRFLKTAECRRLINASEQSFRPLVCAALLTGMRYGELAQLQASHFDSVARVISVREGKTGKMRHVPLTSEGVAFFSAGTENLGDTDLIFTKADGTPWKKSEQGRPMGRASNKAKLDPPASFHDLRRAYGALLARSGVQLQVISKAMGHSDTRMTERHYAHLQPDHVAREVRRNLPTFLRKRLVQ